MIHGRYWDIHDDKALKRIDAAAVRLLTETGVRIHHEGLLDIMGAAGADVNKDTLRCTFTEKHIRDVIEHFRGQASDEVTFTTGFNPQHHMGYGGSFPHLLDWPSGKRRLATKQDVLDIWKMGHALPEFGCLSKVLTCGEIDQRVEPLWAIVKLFEMTDKPIFGGEIFYAEYIEPLMRMGEVLSGEPNDLRLVVSADFFIAPLIMDRKQAEVFLEKRRLGHATSPGTMVISGMSGPATIAGTAAVAVAEILAGWMFGHAVRPDLPARGGVSTGSMDMRTMSARFGSPEAILQDMTVAQVCRRLYGITVGVATGYVDCKRPGIEATFEKMLPLAASPFGAGWDPGGLLSAGQDYCPVQHFLDAEIGKAIERIHGNFEISDETLAVELTKQVMQADQTDFLQTDHTLEHYAENWYPRWFDRSLWQGTDFEVAEERKMLERINTHINDAIATYEPPDVDKAKLAELKSIYKAAKKKILG